MLGQRKIWLGVIIVSLVSLSYLVCFRVQAKTFVESSKTGHFTVIVKMVFYFQKDIKSTEQIISRWEQGMNKIWNKPQPDSKVTYVFQLLKMNNGQTCADYADYHCLEVVAGKYTHNGELATSVIAVADGQQNGWGQWTSQLDGKQAAHEVGHLMGLADEYHYDIKYIQQNSSLPLGKYLQPNNSAWSAYDAVNLAFKLNKADFMVAFDLRENQDITNYGEICFKNSQPINAQGYEAGDLTARIFLPEVSDLSFITLNLGSDVNNGIWADLKQDNEGHDLKPGWNTLQIKLDQMTSYGQGLDFKNINLFYLRLTTDRGYENLAGIKLTDLYLQKQQSIKQAVWVNDNYQPAGPQSIMAKTWGSVVALTEQQQKIIQASNF